MDFQNVQRQASSEESSSDSRDMQIVNASAKKKEGSILISFDEKFRDLISSHLQNDSQLVECLTKLFCNIIKMNSFDEVQCLDFIFIEKTILSSFNKLLFCIKQGIVTNNGPVPAIANNCRPEEYFNHYYESQFKELSQIGSGGQGRVYRAEHLVDQTIYAIKKIAIKCSSTNLFNSLKEVRTLAQLDHENIVKYKNSWIQSVSESDYQLQGYLSDETSEDSENSNKSSNAPMTEARLILYIKMSLCKQSLQDWLLKREDNYSSAEVISSIVMQILSALEYIHKQRIIHHDVNPCNIFIKSNSEKLQIQLGDFGLACSSRKDKHSEGMGTYPYIAPEQWKGNCYTRSDIYSFGVVLLELLKPMATRQELFKVLKTLKKQRTVPKDVIQKYPKWVPVLKMTTEYNPWRRPVALTLLNYLKSKINSDDVKALKKVNNTIRQLNNKLTMENKQKNQEIRVLKLTNMLKDAAIARLETQNAQLLTQLTFRLPENQYIDAPHERHFVYDQSLI